MESIIISNCNGIWNILIISALIQIQIVVFNETIPAAIPEPAIDITICIGHEAKKNKQEKKSGILNINHT